ncbi:MAG: hypothetical protein OEY50_10525 [Nitrospinota bacterium]|nr:hypothetical protein [Nitrospinota bacterium]MDH5756152.1 hypothetical protein [Nitrospinota bacterium]
MAWAEDPEQEYVVVRSADGVSVMEKAWVVTSRIVVTTPFDMDAYMADSDGVLTSSKAGVSFLARNRFEWMKVYTSDVDLPVSEDIPSEVLNALSGLNQAIERAGGLENFKKSVRPRQKKQQRQAPVVTADLDKTRIS